jgi:HPt (histidine-containing phosphotransfer) domain-containing protein
VTRPLAELPRLDMRVLDGIRELQGDDAPDLLRQVADLYLEDAPKHLAAMLAAAGASDAQTISRCAHALKFSGLCKAVEFASRAGDLSGLPQDLPALANEWRLAEQALRDAVSAIPA